jgi:hypothetical protein
LSESVSILELVKRGGYEASLFTTFNATLPFYEEVLLRRLVGAGCRHNVVLMDRAQCAASWASEATRPRRAGHAYTLLPVGAPGAFHPKLCMLVGPKKASILIGSHNLTLSGFGYNQEVTNWVEVAGPKDAEGAALLADAWQMVTQWIQLERGKTADALLDAVMAMASFISPLVASVEPSTRAVALTHTPAGPPLIDQISERVAFDVRRIGIVGAFFDSEWVFIDEIARRWPNANLVVGIDPDTVQVLARSPCAVARFVDVRKLWPERSGYLHAKMIWFDSEDSGGAFVSGSANPSRPAWMGPAESSNVEAVLVRLGHDARVAAESVGLSGLFDLEDLDDVILRNIAERGTTAGAVSASAQVPIWSGVSIVDSGAIRIFRRGSTARIDGAMLFDGDLNALGDFEIPEASGDELVLPARGYVSSVRSCLLYADGAVVARALIHHPDAISASMQSSRQNQIRNALDGLGASEGDISRVIASIERVIFSVEALNEVDSALRKSRAGQAAHDQLSGPESLAVSVSELSKARRKLRILKSGDLSYLLDALLHRLAHGLEDAPHGIDATGLTEEERVGSEDEDEERPTQSVPLGRSMSDIDVARAVSGKARALTKRMAGQLSRASRDPSLRAGAVVQLIAVVALVRELRRLDATPRWRATGHLLVDEKDRRYLLNESLKHLLGSASRMLDEIDGDVPETEEGVQLRVLLLWLAWDLGEELTEQVDRILDGHEKRARLRTNAVFLELLPPIADDEVARAELAQSISRTIRQTPAVAVRAAGWLDRHFVYGAAWSKGVTEGGALRVGGYCRVPGRSNAPRIILDVSDRYVQFWDFDDEVSFERDRVVTISPLSDVQ